LKIINVVGARPNFMKIAPILRALKKIPSIHSMLLHTGQHYDVKMSDVFFRDLEIPSPDIHLNVGSSSHAQQTAEIMIKFEEVLQKEKPDLVLVVGDVNSTLACSVTAAKAEVLVAHVEAGLRSFDRTMPEEINRMVTDTLSDFLFTTEKSGRDNLLKEGKKDHQIFFTGNVMVDSLVFAKDRMPASPPLERFNVAPQAYALITLHRPSNVDRAGSLEKIMRIMETIQKQIKIIFPIHPRSLKMMESFGYAPRISAMKGLTMTEPLGYLDFLTLMRQAKFVMTDSGGLQEESTFLGVPCLTMRENTERPVTYEIGTNTLVGLDEPKIFSCVESIVNGTYKKGSIPELWDGHAAERIVQILEKVTA
jgi:UDP-N-acetylglucosamine 2-epimerase (non-hydrolysing)